MNAPFNALIRRKVRLFTRVIAILLFLSGPQFASATPQPESLGHYQYATWGVEAGLPQVTVTSMARGPDGHMWLGTQNGLARLDGQDIEVFQLDKVQALGSNWIKHLLATGTGDLWISTLKHLLLYRDGEFKVVASREQLGEVTALSVDGSGRVWVAADRLWYLDGTTITLFEQWPSSVRAMVAGAYVWVANANSEIFRLGQQKIEQILWPAQPLVVRQMAIIKQRLWLATNEGLYRSIGTQLERVTDQPVYALATYADELWFASKAGVFRWRGEAIEGRLLAESAHSLALVTALFVDENNAFWLGSQAHGARYYWRAPYVQMSAEDGLTDFSWSLLPDRDGLLVGTNQGVFSRLQRNFTHTVAATDIPGGVAYALLRDSIDRLWVGTREGLAVQEQGRWRPIAELNGEQVNSIIETQNGDVLIGSARGLKLWSEGNIKVLEGAEALLGQSVRTLLEDDKQNLWVGTENGLWRWRAGKLESEVTQPLDQDFIPALLQLQDGRLIAATYQRGIYVRSVKGDWKPLVLERGLPTQGAFGLFEQDDWLWISSGDGIQRVAINQLASHNPNLQVVYYDAGDNLGRSRLRCCNGGGNGRAVVSDGFAWFASLGGVVRVNLNLPEVKVPVVKIRKVLDAGSALSGAMKDVEIHYGVLDFRSAHQLEYRYRLKPYNEQWQAASERRIAYYTNLPPGDLIFEVQAKQTYGQWGPTATALIHVKPIYYETGWFKIVLSLLIIFVGYGIFRIWTFRLRLRSQHLAQEIKTRTKQLEQMNAELERVNNELHHASVTDPLTGLHNRRFMAEQISYLLAQLKRKRQEGSQHLVLGFFLIDLDWFKHINDRYGHGVGDALLVETAKQMKKSCRESDLLLRWGGEEFLLVAPESSPEEFSRIATRLRLAVAEAGDKMGLPLNISASVGCMPHPVGAVSDISNWEFTMALADYCLYQAKASGRNCCTTGELDEDLLSTYRDVKITSRELTKWQSEGRLRISILASETNTAPAAPRDNV